MVVSPRRVLRALAPHLCGLTVEWTLLEALIAQRFEVLALLDSTARDAPEHRAIADAAETVRREHADLTAARVAAGCVHANVACLSLPRQPQPVILGVQRCGSGAYAI
jgi:hypothetical protein